MGVACPHPGPLPQTGEGAHPVTSSASRPMTLSPYSVDRLDDDAMRAGFEVGGQARDPDVRARLGLDPRLLVASLRAKTSSTNGSGVACGVISIGARSPMRISPWSWVRRRTRWRPASRRRAPRARSASRSNCAGAEIAVTPLFVGVEAAVDRKPHLPPVRLLGGDEARLVGEPVDRQDVEAVRASRRGCRRRRRRDGRTARSTTSPTPRSSRDDDAAPRPSSRRRRRNNDARWCGCGRRSSR